MIHVRRIRATHNPCGSSISKGNSSNTSGSSHSEFTDEEECRFARRYREGYDLTDPRYSAWLKVNYPTEPCQEQELGQYFSDVLPLEPIDMSVMESISSECENAGLQATVTPGLTPAHVVNHSVDYPTSTMQSTVTHITPGLTPTHVVNHSPVQSVVTNVEQSTVSEVTPVTPTVSRPIDASQNSDSDTPMVSNASAPPLTSATTSSTILTSPLSKYLVQYVVPLPEKRATH